MRGILGGTGRLIPVMLLFHIFFNSDFGSFGYLVNYLVVSQADMLFSWPGVFLLRLGLVLSLALMVAWALNLPVTGKCWLPALPVVIPIVLLPIIPDWVLPAPYQWLDRARSWISWGDPSPVLVVSLPIIGAVILSFFRGWLQIRKVVLTCLVSVLVTGLLLFPWRGMAVTEENHIRLAIIAGLQQGRAVIYTDKLFPVQEKPPAQLVGISFAGGDLYAPGRSRCLRDPLTGVPVEVITMGPIVWRAATEAEVEVHRIYGSMASSGGLMILQKTSQGWQIVSWQINWQSCYPKRGC